MCFRGFAVKDFFWRAFIFYARPRVKNERTPKYYFPARPLLNSYVIIVKLQKLKGTKK